MTPPSPRAPKPTGWQQHHVGGAVLLVAAVLLTAVNLRPAVSSVGPVLADIRADLALSAAAVSALTALPVVCYGFGALLAPRLARRFGSESVMAAMLALLTLGLLVRLGPTTSMLFVGTFIATSGIAVGNVLIPALIKRKFPEQAGLMMGLFVSVLIASTAVAAGATVPLTRVLDAGWRTGLAVWAVPAAFATLVWSAVALRRWQRQESTDRTTEVPSSLRRDPVAWQVTAFMASQSMVFYSLLSWLPTVLRSHGTSPGTAGQLLSVMVVMGAPAALVLPSLLTRTRGQRSWAVLVTTLTALGVTGLLLAPTAAPLLWVVLMGAGTGGALPLALTLMVLRSPNAQRAAQLSAMSQSVGYLLAAAGPFVFGMVRGATGGWTAPLLVLLLLLMMQASTGVAAGRPLLVADR